LENNDSNEVLEFQENLTQSFSQHENVKNQLEAIFKDLEKGEE